MDRNRYELGLYEKAMPGNLSWKEKLELTRESGFDYLEMSVDESDEKLARLDWTQEERDIVKEIMICLLYTSLWEKALNFWKKASLTMI